MALHHDGPQIVITGTGDVVLAVTSLLAQQRVIAEDLRVEQTSLEDAYLALTADGGASSEIESEGN